ncbi:MAG TPA: hypothetical protein VLL97_01030 [Acidobacteriota bacterium]|nr:hypothetical protein [Acidobacteriota bacterium]
MLAQIVLTPAESKKLIAKAVAGLDIVRQAAKNGIVALHPSSSTYFIVEEITGSAPKTNYWVCGVVAPRGMCVEMAMVLGTGLSPDKVSADPGDLQGTWVIEKGRLGAEEKLSSLLNRMTESDIYVKGVNALDTEGNVGVLFGLEGSMGYIQAASNKRNFTIVYPAGLEKLIPVSVRDAAKEARFHHYESCMGMPVGLFPCAAGVTVTEIRAIELLSGASAIPIASGGLGGAEGAITLVLKGATEEVEKALDFVEKSKGARLPDLRLCNCDACPVPDCSSPRTDRRASPLR